MSCNIAGMHYFSEQSSVAKSLKFLHQDLYDVVKIISRMLFKHCIGAEKNGVLL